AVDGWPLPAGAPVLRDTEVDQLFRKPRPRAIRSPHLRVLRGTDGLCRVVERITSLIQHGRAYERACHPVSHAVPDCARDRNAAQPGAATSLRTAPTHRARAPLRRDLACV